MCDEKLLITLGVKRGLITRIFYDPYTICTVGVSFCLNLLTIYLKLKTEKLELNTEKDSHDSRTINETLIEDLGNGNIFDTII